MSATEENNILFDEISVASHSNRKRANNKPSKVIKGSTTVSKTPAKIWKERAVQLIPMSKKSHSFSEQEINDLKKQMGIESLSNAVDKMLQLLVNSKSTDTTSQP